jgi:hypothetical protein
MKALAVHEKREAIALANPKITEDEAQEEVKKWKERRNKSKYKNGDSTVTISKLCSKIRKMLAKNTDEDKMVAEIVKQKQNIDSIKINRLLHELHELDKRSSAIRTKLNQG